MKCKLLSTVVLIATLCFATIRSQTAQAEIAIWPGTVVAPFVRVQWNWRQVHVCAPFVNIVVDLGRCCCECGAYADYGRAPNQLSQTTHRLKSQPTWRQLTKSAAKLDKALDQFETSESWQRYLAVQPGEVLSEPAAQDAINAINKDSLTVVLRHFDAANRDQQYRQIASLPEFQEVHTLLANYLALQRSPPSAHPIVENLSSSGSAWELAFEALRSGQAIDTARIAIGNPTHRPVSTSSAAVKTSLTAPEELPEPVRKSGI
ncbi:MAG TPA: hypothetical protein VGJ04_03510 [Pirellulales bacterium]